MPDILGAWGGVCRNFCGVNGGYAGTFVGLVSGVWCLSAWNRFHRTHRIRLPRPGWAGRRHTAAGEASIASLSSAPRSPPPPRPSGPRRLPPGATRRGPEGGSLLSTACPRTAQCWNTGGHGSLSCKHDMHCAVSGHFRALLSSESRGPAHAGPASGWKGGVTAHAAGTSAPLFT